MKQWIGPGNQTASYDPGNGKPNRFSCHFLGHAPLSPISMACAQAILFENKKRMTAPSMVGSSAPECLVYSPAPTFAPDPHYNPLGVWEYG